ncbi:MAG: helix-hairpin-helix domain-containing protein [Crocinitomicaceae bacterium]|nr:helix-hairpin-helix domain-containing protein [Crocinitomicaceae bacterium]
MKAYFKVSRKQRIGIISLSCIIIFLVMILNVNYYRELPDPTIFDASEISFVDLENEIEDKANYPDDKVQSMSSNNSTYQLFDFNPNTLDQKGWEKLGFSAKQSVAIINYRSKYGPFKRKDDLKNIYVITSEKYTELEPYIIIEEGDLIQQASNLNIDVNRADQEELETIKGIGPAFASRTIKFRESLGGFVSTDQFNEIYGITPEAVQALSDNVLLDQDAVRKININSDTKEIIKKHPYMKDWAVVTAIIDERDKGKLTNLEFLIDKGLKDREEVDKLLPYIIF